MSWNGLDHFLGGRGEELEQDIGGWQMTLEPDQHLDQRINRSVGRVAIRPLEPMSPMSAIRGSQELYGMRGEDERECEMAVYKDIVAI